MGLAKSEWIEAQERGWTEIDKNVCERCVEDEFLALSVKKCDYCGRKSRKPIAAPVQVILAPIVQKGFDMKLLKITLREFINRYKDFIARKRHQRVRKFCESLMLNLEVINAIEGAKSSALFEKKNLQDTPSFKSRQNLFEYSLNAVEVNGLYLELGTYKGDSINMFSSSKFS